MVGRGYVEPVTAKRIVTALLIVIASSVACGVGLKGYYDRKAATMTRDHCAAIRLCRQECSTEVARKKRRHREELERTYGRGIHLFTRDPDLSLSQMLRKVAVAATSPGTEVEVKADNFSEFDIYLTVKDELARERAARVVKKILGACSEYVNSISFVYQGTPVKMIERRAIEKVRDWQTASLDSIASAMVAP